jgi:hypothetical protein
LSPVKGLGRWAYAFSSQTKACSLLSMPGIAIGQAGVGSSAVGIFGDSLLKVVDRLLECIHGSLVPEVLTFQIRASNKTPSSADGGKLTGANSASRTPPWYFAGWGCPEPRLSRSEEDVFAIAMKPTDH